MGVRRRAVGNQHHRASGPVKLRQMPDHLGGIFRVEVGGRLVGEDEIGSRNHGPRDGDTLLLAPGELVGSPIGHSLQTHLGEHLLHPSAALGRGHLLKQHDILDVFDHVENGDQVVGLEDEADMIAAEVGQLVAAHVANAGVDVILLDIVPEGAKKRSELALKAVEGMLKTEPAPFMEKRNAKRITCGNIEDDLTLVAEADWIVEAVVEKLDIKQTIYRQIDSVRKPGSIVTSNTSTIPCGDLMNGMDESFQRDFLITHFFNPPRYLRLFELISGPEVNQDKLNSLIDFADKHLGKAVVQCKDTPGFIGNRIGVYWMQCAIMKRF